MTTIKVSDEIEVTFSQHNGKFSYDGESFELWADVEKHIKALAKLKYKPVTAIHYSRFDKYETVTITRPANNGYRGAERVWIKNGEGKRETKDLTYLFDISCSQELSDFVAKLEELRKEESAIEKLIDALPRAKMPELEK